jgi:hypothetical protein
MQRRTQRQVAAALGTPRSPAARDLRVAAGRCAATCYRCRVSDAPFFPDPTGKAPSLGPYRAPEKEKPTPPPAPRAIDVALAASLSRDRNEHALARAQRIDDAIAAHARAKRNALLQIAFGVVLLAVGVIATIAAEGAIVFYGAAVAGVGAIMRGSAALLRIPSPQE